MLTKIYVFQVSYYCGRARAFIVDSTANPSTPDLDTQVLQNFTCGWDNNWDEQNDIKTCYCQSRPKNKRLVNVSC